MASPASLTDINEAMYGPAFGWWRLVPDDTGIALLGSSGRRLAGEEVDIASPMKSYTTYHES